MTDALAQIPQSAGARLADAASGKCFSSDLSVNEFMLVRETGFEPLGMVLGSSVYHIGIQVKGFCYSLDAILSSTHHFDRRLFFEKPPDHIEDKGDVIADENPDFRLFFHFVSVSRTRYGTSHHWKFVALT